MGVAIGMFLFMLVLLFASAGSILAGIALVRRYLRNKDMPFVKYGTGGLSGRFKLTVGIVLIVLGSLFLFWVVWNVVEWVVLTS